MHDPLATLLDTMADKKRSPRKRLTLDQQALYLWRFKLTTPGKGFLLFFLVSISIGASSLNIPVYRLVCALFSLFFLSFLVGWVFHPRLKIQGVFPDRAVVGEKVETRYSVINVSRIPAYDLAMSFFMLPRHLESAGVEEIHPGLSPGERATLPVSILPAKRGVYPLPNPLLHTTFPFHLFRTRFGKGLPTDGAPRSLKVVPSYHPLEKVEIPARRRYQPGGVPYSSHIGESMEYVGNREYRPGDPMHRIDFKSWGRIARPVVREYQEEYYLRIGLVLDTQVPTTRREPRLGFPVLEAAISLTAAISDFLIRQDHVIDLFAAGQRVYRLTAGRHTAQMEQVLEILACLEPTRTNPFPMVNEEVGEYLGGLSCLIGLFLSWDESREKIIREASSMGCGHRIVLVGAERTSSRDPETFSFQRFQPEDILEGRVGAL